MSYVNSVSQGINWMESRSIYPKDSNVGDAFFDEDSGKGYVCVAKNNWQQMYAGPEDPNIVTLDQLYALYPDFKELADKYTEWEILKRSGNQNDSIQ